MSLIYCYCKCIDVQFGTHSLSKLINYMNGIQIESGFTTIRYCFLPRLDKSCPVIGYNIFTKGGFM